MYYNTALDKAGFESTKRNGVFVFHSSSCWTCDYHIENLERFVSFYSIDIEEDYDYYETNFGITTVPVTRIYQDGVVVWEMIGALFESQINEMRRLLERY